VTAHIDCLVVAGFPGIGKTTTAKKLREVRIGACCYDLDVRDFGTTNGIDVADPGEYVRRVVACVEEGKEKARENSCVFVTIDSVVRAGLREAGLFYLVIAPEFPPSMANQIPHYRPDPLLKSRYMKRFSDNPGYNSQCAQLLEGNGYEAALLELFNDPMPHMIMETLNAQSLDQCWMVVEQLTRQVMSPQMLAGMPGAPRNPGMIPPGAGYIR
jgi:hypothetical protein